MNERILEALSLGWTDVPEEILDSCSIDYENLEWSEIEEKVNSILGKYNVLDDVVNDTDLEKSYTNNTLYFEYEGQLYGVDYQYSPYEGFWVMGNPYKAKKIIKTITVDTYEKCD